MVADRDIVGCGWYTTDSSAAIFKVSTDGTFRAFWKIAVDSTTSAYNKCYGIAYEASTNLISALI